MIKRRLKYSLIKNNFSNNYYGIILSREAELESFLQYYKPVLGESSYNMLIDGVKNFFNEQMYQGNSINIFDYCILQSKLKGEFMNQHDSFDPKRHHFELTIKEGAEFQKIFNNYCPKLKKIASIKR